MVTLNLTVMKNLLFILLFMVNSCSRTHDEAKDDKLSVVKTNYVGSDLKIDGYYYSINKFGDYGGAQFFYENGISHNIGGSANSLILLEEYINQVSNNNGAKYKSGWGLFKITGNSLYYEQWDPKPFGGIHKVFSHECEIINDNTYIIKKQYRLVNGEQTEVTFPNQTYKFVAFANKPSSVNDFIP
jgi:hypothetical protein